MTSARVEANMVLEGKDGVLFLQNDTNDVIAQVEGRHPVTDQELYRIACEHAGRYAFLRAIGANYLHVIVPDKETYLTEKLPATVRPRAYGPSPLERYLASAAGLVHRPVYLLSEFRKHLGPRAFLRSDTHWTAEAAIWYLCEALKDCAPQLSESIRSLPVREVSIEIDGDLGQKVRASKEKTKIFIPKESKSYLVFENKKQNYGKIRVYKSDYLVEVNRIVVIHDSFIEWLVPLLCEAAKNIVFVQMSEIDWEFIVKFSPDIVIFQQVERFFVRVPSYFTNWEMPFDVQSNILCGSVVGSKALHNNRVSMPKLNQLITKNSEGEIAMVENQNSSSAPVYADIPVKAVLDYRFGYVPIKISNCPEFFMFNNNDDFVAAEFSTGKKDAFEPFSLKLWLSIASKSACVIDVGSYSGIYSLSAASINRKTKVFSIEANTIVYSRLLVNRRVNNLANIEPINCAASNEDGEIEINIYSGDDVLSSISSIVDRRDDRKIYTKKLVKKIKLDDVFLNRELPKVGAIKIDAEGAEHLVIEGAMEIIKKFNPDIIMEALPGFLGSQVTEELARLGYNFYALDEHRKEAEQVPQITPTGHKGQVNFLLSKRNKLEIEAMI